MALDIHKTGTDIKVTLGTTVEGEDLVNLTQMNVVFYYLRAGIKTKISFHSLVPTAPGILAEAKASGRTVHQLTLNGSDIETVIPAEDTVGLALTDCEKVKVLSEFSFTDGIDDKGKQPADSEILQLLNSVTGVV